MNLGNFTHNGDMTDGIGFVSALGPAALLFRSEIEGAVPVQLLVDREFGEERDEHYVVVHGIDHGDCAGPQLTLDLAAARALARDLEAASSAGSKGELYFGEDLSILEGNYGLHPEPRLLSVRSRKDGLVKLHNSAQDEDGSYCVTWGEAHGLAYLVLEAVNLKS
jgi:hypothetical protein